MIPSLLDLKLLGRAFHRRHKLLGRAFFHKRHTVLGRAFFHKRHKLLGRAFHVSLCVCKWCIFFFSSGLEDLKKEF